MNNPRILQLDTAEIMKQRLLVLIASEAAEIEKGKYEKMPLKNASADIGVVKLPRGLRAYEMLFFIDQLTTSNHYNQVYEAGNALAKEQLPVAVKASRKPQMFPLVLLPHLYEGSSFNYMGVYRLMVPEALLPDYVALHQYYERMNGWAFALNTDYRRDLYAYFNAYRNKEHYITVDDLFGSVLQVPDNKYKKDGAWLFGEINRSILLPTIGFLCGVTDLDIAVTSYKYYPHSQGAGRKRIEGITFKLTTIPGRVAPGAEVRTYSYYQLLDKLGLTKSQCETVLKTLSRLEVHEFLRLYNETYQPSLNKKVHAEYLLKTHFTKLPAAKFRNGDPLAALRISPSHQTI